MISHADFLFVYGELIAQLCNFPCNLILVALKVNCDHLHPLGNKEHFLLLKSSACNSGSTDSQAACNKGALGVVGDGVLVCCDVNSVQHFLVVLTRNVKGSEVYEHKMVVRTAGNQSEALVKECLAEHL